jgi:hypothetical protein
MCYQLLWIELELCVDSWFDWNEENLLISVILYGLTAFWQRFELLADIKVDYVK